MDIEEEEIMPFQYIEKTTVIQDCRQFSAVSVKPKKCIEVIMNILYILMTGHTITATEATEVFFGATKLFQNNDPRLRRLLFILLKELSSVAEQVFIASSSLVKDISSQNDMYKCNAIRTLRLVTDSTMIGPMERYLRQAVVDNNTNVVAAAVVTGIHLAEVTPEMVKRWGTEVSEALKSRGQKSQYHALALLHKLRKSDRISVMKLVQQAQAGAIRSPMALCLLIKLSTELMQEDYTQSAELYKFVTSMTNNSSEAVVFEAAKSICSIRALTSKEVMPAILVLQLYLSSARPILLFAAVRLLSKVAVKHPAAVATCNIDLEALISHSNRNIGILAITTLLQTGNEFTVERLLKQVSTFMHELSDEYKVVVVDSVKHLCKKFPEKYPVMLQFLSDVLKEEGSAELKRSIVEGIIGVVDNLEQARELALALLAEFIEDCEFNVLVQRVLFLIAEHAPSCSAPHKFIRYVNNRIALEQAPVRATAIATLAKIAARCPDLRERIAVLLKRAATDPDDEVRDRAVLYHKILSHGDDYIIKSLILDVAKTVNKNIAKQPIIKPAGVVEVAAESADEVSGAGGAGASLTGAVAGQLTSIQIALREKMTKIPELAAFGVPSKTSELTALTEPDCEYNINVIKHVYPERIVLQYQIKNTIEDQSLYKVSVEADFSDVELSPELNLQVPEIKPGETGYAYTVLEMVEGTFPVGAAAVSCHFAISEPETPEEEVAELETEEFGIEEYLYITMSDFLVAEELPNFEASWDEEAEEQHEETYVLETMENLTQMASEFIKFYGMYVRGGDPGRITTNSHVVEMSGKAVLSDALPILIRGKVFLTSDAKVALTLTIRGGGLEELRELLSQALVS